MRATWRGPLPAPTTINHSTTLTICAFCASSLLPLRATSKAVPRRVDATLNRCVSTPLVTKKPSTPDALTESLRKTDQKQIPRTCRRHEQHLHEIPFLLVVLSPRTGFIWPQLCQFLSSYIFVFRKRVGGAVEKLVEKLRGSVGKAVAEHSAIWLIVKHVVSYLSLRAQRPQRS